jgi:hypothetical protein
MASINDTTRIQNSIASEGQTKDTIDIPQHPKNETNRTNRYAQGKLQRENKSETNGIEWKGMKCFFRKAAVGMNGLVVLCLFFSSSYYFDWIVCCLFCTAIVVGSRWMGVFGIV